MEKEKSVTQARTEGVIILYIRTLNVEIEEEGGTSPSKDIIK